MKSPNFLPTDILLPQSSDLTKWSVVASDQYTSQASYWQTVEDFVGRDNSTLRITLPESCLDGPDVEADIMSINSAMSHYLREEVFSTYPQALVYLERTLDNGTIRKGIVGQIDLEEYDYTSDATTPIRGAETILLPRIPPRVAVRKNAPLEVSHVVILADDETSALFSGLSKENVTTLYDCVLMEEGGQVWGGLLTEEQQEEVLKTVKILENHSHFTEKYHTTTQAPLLQFAVGDGNHSLATAKECYERQKKIVNPDQWATLPSRYAMVELVSIHDEAVALYPIHRVLHNVDPQEFLRDFRVEVEQYPENMLEHQDYQFYFGENQGVMTVRNPISPIATSTLQPFLDTWLTTHPKVQLDYCYVEEEAKSSATRHNTLSIILPPFNKKELFPTLVHQGILPRKTFALGLPQHKRYYLEARKIR